MSTPAMKENQQVEWKQSWRDECLKWICDFANADGLGEFPKTSVETSVETSVKTRVETPVEILLHFLHVGPQKGGHWEVLK